MNSKSVITFNKLVLGVFILFSLNVNSELKIENSLEIPSVPTRGIISDQVAQKIELPADPNLANAPSSQIIAQTKKPIPLTELERSPIFSLLRNRGIA